MAEIVIDGQVYDTDNFSEESRKQLSMIKFVERRIAELQGEIAIFQTARSAYAKALAAQLPTADSLVPPANNEKS